MVRLVTYRPSRWPVRIDHVGGHAILRRRYEWSVAVNTCKRMRLQSAGATLLAELLDDCPREAAVASERRPRTAV